MASETSRRPAWQEKVLDIPTEQRSWSQRIFAQCIELFDETASILCDYGSRNALDIKTPDIVRALCWFYCATVRQGNFSAGFLYYQPRKQNKKTKKYLNTVIDEILEQDIDESNPDPEVLVPMWVAATLTMGMYTCLSRENIEGAVILCNRKQLDVCSKLSKLRTLAIKIRCDDYLKKELGFRLMLSLNRKHL